MKHNAAKTVSKFQFFLKCEVRALERNTDTEQ